jgi:hypothetical protein
LLEGYCDYKEYDMVRMDGSTEAIEQNIPEGTDVGATAEEERGQKWIHRNDSKREKQ